MSDYPDEWFRGGKADDGKDAADNAADETIAVSRPAHPGGQYQVRRARGEPAAGVGQPGPAELRKQGNWPSQPPARSDGNIWAGGVGAAGGGVAAPAGPPAPGRPRRPGPPR